MPSFELTASSYFILHLLQTGEFVSLRSTFSCSLFSAIRIMRDEILVDVLSLGGEKELLSVPCNYS